MKFRKKPVVIEATQWFKNGDHPEDGADASVEGQVVRYFRRPDKPGTLLCEHCGKTMHEHGWIDTKEGGHIVCPGDWVITGVQGEHYPCKPDIFVATYHVEMIIPEFLKKPTPQSLALDEVHGLISWAKETLGHDEDSATIISMRVIERALTKE